MKTHIVKRTKLAPIERTPTPHFPDIARSIACRLGYDDEHIVFEAVILDADHAGVGDGARKSPASLYRWFAKGKPHGDRPLSTARRSAEDSDRPCVVAWRAHHVDMTLDEVRAKLVGLW